MILPHPLRVAVLGGGPAGSTLATLLVRKGCEAALWDDGKKPELVVGESLIPAVIPILRKLGIEDEVAAISVRKPGVSFEVDPDRVVRFSFTSVRGILPTYAYNIPRPRFDNILRHRAARSGASIVPNRAKISYAPEVDKILMAEGSLAEAGWADQPDLVVDATGRSRLISRTAGISHRAGSRNDIALFAHFKGVASLSGDPSGQVAIARSGHGGWSWRIPLQDVTSVGIVLPRESAKALGGSPADRLENALASDAILGPAVAGARRVTDVATYSNYQLVSDRAFGANWALVGDAFGFVDPMLSPGLCLALNSANWLADALPARSGISFAPALESFASQFYTQLESWSELIDLFYHGDIFNLYYAGGVTIDQYTNPFSKVVAEHVSKHISCMCAGASTARAYSRKLLRIAARYGADPADAPQFAIA